MKKSIVIVDSDLILIEDLKRGFVLDNNYEVIDVATSGMEGYQKVARIRPEVVIISYPLMDVDIFKLIDAINKVTPNTKKIVTLEIDNPTMSRECMKYGANHVISKPYSIQTILQLLEPSPLETVDLGKLDSAFGQFGTPQGSQMPQGGFGGGFPQQPQQPTNPQGSFGGGFPQGQGGYGQPQQQNQGGFGSFPQQPQQPVNPQGQGNFGGGFPQGGGFGGQQMPQGQGFGGGFEQPQGQFGGMQQPQGQQFGGGMPQGNYPQGQGQFGGGMQPQGQGGYGQGQGQQQMGAYRTIKQTIISIYSPKGGVGKTTLSKEMASAFAKVTINGIPLKVLLVDVDIEFGDVCSMFRLTPRPNVMDWKKDIDYIRSQGLKNEDIRFSMEQIEEKYLIKHQQSGLRILPAPINHGDHYDFTRHDMKVILNNLKACDYDVIMLDLGNNTKDYTYTSLEESNQVLMVITMDLACLNDTNLLFGTLRSLNFTMDKIKFVANKMPKDARLDINVKDIEETFGVPILEYIPENPNMRTVNNSGNPLVLTTDNEYTKAVISLANKVVPVFPQRRPSGGGGQVPNGKGNNRQQAPKGNKGNGGFFGKLFGKK